MPMIYALNPLMRGDI